MVLLPRYRDAALRSVVPFACFVLASCAAAPTPPAEAPPTSEELTAPPLAIESCDARGCEPDVVPASSTLAIPSQCGDDNAAGICGPPTPFVKDVCAGFAKPDIALVLFAKGSPWTRGYLRLNVEAWYTGSRSPKVGLKLDEEVIVLAHPNPVGGIIVNGAGGPFDIMRLDGRCATLTGEEVTLKRPPSPKHPPIPWKQLDPRTREALLADSSVSEASSAADGCSDTTTACAKAGSKLTNAILDFIARGGKIPMLTARR